MEDLGLASRLSALDGTDIVQLPRTLGYGETFRLLFAIARNEELALSSGTMLIDPVGKPEYLKASCFLIGDNFISGDTWNAGCIVPAKASAEPDLMFKRRVLQEKCVSIFNRSLQCFALSVMN